jgi:hypothetical protein
VRSFLLGRRLFAVLLLPTLEEEEEVEMRETKEERLMVRLSRLEERNVSLTEASGRKILEGRRGWIWPVMRW